MDETASALSAVIGERVRQERQARKWTLDTLADLARISRRMVVNVEQGSANPSIATLLRISGALGIGLPALVEPPEREAVTITRAGSGAALWTGAAGGRGVLVAGTEPPNVLELWEWTLGAGDRRSSDAHSPGTRELLHVHKGPVTVRVGDEVVVLASGDAVGFSGDLPHEYANPGTETVRFSLAVLEPGVGSSAHTDAAAEEVDHE